MKPLFVVVFTMGIAWVTQAANSTPGTASSAKTEAVAEAAKPAAATLPAIPNSVFESLTVYKDPFHPRSTRRVKVEPGKQNDAPPPVEQLASLLMLNGFSTLANKPTTMINGRTFEIDETAEVQTGAGKPKIKVHCLEINMENKTVVVEVGAERTRAVLRMKD